MFYSMDPCFDSRRFWEWNEIRNVFPQMCFHFTSDFAAAFANVFFVFVVVFFLLCFCTILSIVFSTKDLLVHRKQYRIGHRVTSIYAIYNIVDLTVQGGQWFSMVVCNIFYFRFILLDKINKNYQTKLEVLQIYLIF